MFGLMKAKPAATAEPDNPVEPAQADTESAPAPAPRDVRVKLLQNLANSKRVFRIGDILNVRASTAFRMEAAGEAAIVSGALTEADAASAVDAHGEIEVLDQKFHAIAAPHLETLVRERDALIAEFAAIQLPHGTHETSRVLQVERFAMEKRRFEQWEQRQKFAPEYAPITVVGADTPPKPKPAPPRPPVNWPAKSRRIEDLEYAIRQQKSELTARRAVAATRQSIRLAPAFAHLVDQLNSALDTALTAVKAFQEFKSEFRAKTGCEFSSAGRGIEISNELTKQLRDLKGDAQHNVDAAWKSGVLALPEYPTIADLPKSPPLLSNDEMP
jgi:hypothetical protein